MSRAMKDSGYPWIGEIPLNWEIRRLRFLGEVSGGMANKKPEDFGHGTPFISYKNVYKNMTIRDDYGDCVEATKSDLVKYSVNYGDTLFTGSSETADELGLSSTCINEIENATFNGFCMRFRPYDLSESNPEFLKYFFRNHSVRTQLSAYDNSITRANLSQSKLKDVVIIVPPRYEQSKIAGFLDEKCAEIDKVLEKTRASVEEYKKLKQSIITQAVIKGVRGDRPMKNSGIEWIGVVPEEWNVKRGKALFHEVKNQSTTGTEELLTVSQYTGITPRSQKNVTMFQSESLVGYKIVEIGDVGANTMWLWDGAIGVSTYRGVISPSYNVYRQSNGDYDSKYLDYLLRNPLLVQHYESRSTGIRASRLRLYPQQFLSIMFPVPDINEQKTIAEYLDTKCKGIETLIEKKNKLIADLEEYKKSLIYEYVTGKKEVPQE